MPTSVLLAAAFTFLIAIGVTVAIERLGGRYGGVLGTLPTTIVPFSLGLADADPSVARTALLAVPVGMLVNGLFLASWRVLPPYLNRGTLGLRLAAMVLLSMSLWAACAASMVALLGSDLAQRWPPLAIGALGLTLLVGLGLWGCAGNIPAPKGTRRVALPTLLARGLFAAAAIATALMIARSGDGLLSGMASVFPAMFLTAMASLWWSQGEAVPTGAVGPMILGSTSVALYAILASGTLPALGGPAGAAVAWCVAVACTSLPLAAWFRRRRSAPSA